jgi:hypothetical protein
MYQVLLRFTAGNVSLYAVDVVVDVTDVVVVLVVVDDVVVVVVFFLLAASASGGANIRAVRSKVRTSSEARTAPWRMWYGKTQSHKFFPICKCFELSRT